MRIRMHVLQGTQVVETTVHETPLYSSIHIPTKKPKIYFFFFRDFPLSCEIYGKTGEVPCHELRKLGQIS